MEADEDLLGTVLVVDDDRALLRSYEDWLRRRRCHVLTATNADDALRVAMRSAPDLALVDLVLRGKSGSDLIGALKSARPRMPVVAITGYAEWECAVRAMHAGATWVYEKPPDLDHALTILSGTWSPPPRVERSLPSSDDMKAEYLRHVVADCGGVSQAARNLGMRRTSLQKMLRAGRKAARGASGGKKS